MYAYKPLRLCVVACVGGLHAHAYDMGRIQGLDGDGRADRVAAPFDARNRRHGAHRHCRHRPLRRRPTAADGRLYSHHRSRHRHLRSFDCGVAGQPCHDRRFTPLAPAGRRLFVRRVDRYPARADVSRRLRARRSARRRPADYCMAFHHLAFRTTRCGDRLCLHAAQAAPSDRRDGLLECGTCRRPRGPADV